MRVSARLFCEKGYSKVSIREIAQACGINSAMIYYYFSSKKNLLHSLYSYYTERRLENSPDFYKLFQMAETEPPLKILSQSIFVYAGDEMLDHILVAAAREVYDDPESEQFIKENIFNLEKIMRPLLTRMIELGKIKPLDVDGFISVMGYYCFSAAFLNGSAFKQDSETYIRGTSVLFSVITPISDD